jgi:carboxymethylenebutenolidase
MRTALLGAALTLSADVLLTHAQGTPPGGGAPSAVPVTWSTQTFPPCSIDGDGRHATYTNGAAELVGNLYKPEGQGPFAAVLVLHTGGGIGSGEYRFGEQLARAGYVALAPDYFTPQGMTPAENINQGNYTTKTDPIREDLARAVDCLKSLPYVDASRIGVAGFSNGGYFSWFLATRPDVKAIVGWYASFPGRDLVPPNFGRDAQGNIQRYLFSEIAPRVTAPALWLYGDADFEAGGQPGLPIAQRAVGMLTAAGKQVDLVTYPGVGHAFNQPCCYDDASADAWDRTLGFLHETLAGPETWPAWIPPGSAIPSAPARKGPLLYEAKLDGTNADLRPPTVFRGSPAESAVLFSPGAIDFVTRAPGAVTNALLAGVAPLTNFVWEIDATTPPGFASQMQLGLSSVPPFPGGGGVRFQIDHVRESGSFGFLGPSGAALLGAGGTRIAGLNAGRSFTLTLQVEPERYTAWIDGEQVLRVEDSRPTTPFVPYFSFGSSPDPQPSSFRITGIRLYELPS